MGGLGNQLFQYFAGFYVAHMNKSSLKLDSTFSKAGSPTAPVWLDVLQLPASGVRSSPKNALKILVATVRRATRGALARLMGTQERQLKFLRQYRSSDVGYDSNVELLRPPVTLIGYFQTWRFYESLKSAGVAPELKMKKVSEWYLETSDLLDRQGRVLGLHIRKGDYVGNPKIGNLSPSYYEEAVRALRNNLVDWDAIWIFSDDVLAARNELSSLLDNLSNVYFVDPPDHSHSFESLSLMSKTSALVIANSTYSWWAATLGEPSRPIVCPDKWFFQMEDPSDLCPPDWIRAEASWSHR